MPAKPKEEVPQEVVVTELILNETNFKAVEAVSTKVVTQKQFEDFIESSEFLGENSLFVRYNFLTDENQIFDTNSSEASEEVEENFDKPIDLNKSKGQDFNLQFLNNFLALSKETLTKQEFSDFIETLPNQIRALFLYQLNFVKNLQNTPQGDIVTNFKTQATINLNYFKLVQVEIFNGYEQNSDGEDMLSKPIFKRLKKQDLDALSTTTMFRLKNYNNNNLKIDRDMLSFPIQNHNFFIQPDALPSQVRQRNAQEQVAKKISAQHFSANQYDLIGSTSNIVVQPENVSSMETPQQMSPTSNVTTIASTSDTSPASTAVSTSTVLGGSTGGGY